MHLRCAKGADRLVVGAGDQFAIGPATMAANFHEAPRDERRIEHAMRLAPSRHQQGGRVRRASLGASGWRLPKRVSPKAHNFCRAPLRLEGIRRKEREQRVYPLVQSSATPPALLRRELNDIWFLYDVRWARPSRLGGRRQEAGIGVHRPPPWVDQTAAPLGRVSQLETLIDIKIFDLSKNTGSADQACHDP
jgi:hypothetical protein